MTPGGSFEPESLAELTRFAQYMFAGLEKQLNTVANKLDKLDVVSKEQHREDIEFIRAEVKELERELESNRAKAASDLEGFQTKLTNQTRWFIGSIVFPLVGVILTVYSMLRGAG